MSYTVSVGADTTTRELELIVNRPFIPLVADVPAARKMRVSVSGLPQWALKQTSVYVYNADYIPYWEYFDPWKIPLVESQAKPGAYRGPWKCECR